MIGFTWNFKNKGEKIINMDMGFKMKKQNSNSKTILSFITAVLLVLYYKRNISNKAVIEYEVNTI
jgi:hypothetical protein